MKRAFITGLLASAAIAAVEPYMLITGIGRGLASDFMTAGALLALLLVIFGAALLSLASRRCLFSPPELLLVFIMTSAACTIPSWGLMGSLFPVIAGLPYFTAAGSPWQTALLERVPAWLVNQDPQAVRAYHEGLARNAPLAWRPWLTPLAGWALLLFPFFYLGIALAVIFRRQWVEKERLTFPLAQVPLALCRPDPARPDARLPAIFRNRLFWAGFLTAFIVMSLEGLGYQYPHLRFSLTRIIPIFRHTTNLRFSLSFPVLGFAWLLPLNISFSLWFFHLLSTLQSGLFFITGYTLPGPQEAFAGSSAATSFQGGGAMIALAVYTVWLARRHLGDTWRKALGRAPEIDDSSEIISYRAAVFGGLASLLAMAVFLGWLGLSRPATVFFLFFVLVVFIGLARVITQAGIGFARAQCIPPDATAHLLPPTLIGDNGYAALALQYTWAADIRTTVLAAASNGLKISSATPALTPRLVFRALAAALVVAYLVSAASIIITASRHGALNSPGGWFWRGGMTTAIASFAADKTAFPPTALTIIPRINFTLLGATAMSALILLNQRLLWWPLHYIGLPIADTHIMRHAWFSILAAWLLKAILLRYGGVGLYRRSLPLFIGLVSGVIAAAGAWLLVNTLAGTAISRFLVGIP